MSTPDIFTVSSATASINEVVEQLPPIPTPEERAEFISTIMEYYNDEVPEGSNQLLQISTSLLNIPQVSDIPIKSTTLLMSTSSNSNIGAFKKTSISTAEIKTNNIYVDIASDTSFTVEFDDTNRVTITSDPDGNMSVQGVGPILQYPKVNVVSGDSRTINGMVYILVGSAFITVDDTALNTSATNQLHGRMPAPIHGSDRSHETFEHVRFRLRNAWNTNYKSQLYKASAKMAQGPFRAVNNSGDLLSRQNFAEAGSTVPAANCNTKYVYDSSDFIRFKKEKAFSKNYDDVTSGGGTQDNKSVVFKIN
jgi:hypothetical protein